MRCPVCGRENNPDSLYCNSCGARLTVKQPVKGNKNTIQALIIAVLGIILLAECAFFVVTSNSGTNSENQGSDSAAVGSSDAGNDGITTDTIVGTDVDVEPENPVDTDSSSEPEEKAIPANVDIPDDASTYNGHSYYIFDDICESWEQAAEYCSSRGGYLAVINDSEENDYLYDYMLEIGYDEVFFGYSDWLEEGNWKWVGGHESGYEDWGINAEGSQEPNSSNDYEDYAHMNSSMHDGHWNDKKFGQKTVCFFCEWDYEK